MSWGLLASSNCRNCRARRVACAAWTPAFEPVSKKRCTPLCRKLLMTAMIVSYSDTLCKKHKAGSSPPPPSAPPLAYRLDDADAMTTIVNRTGAYAWDARPYSVRPCGHPLDTYWIVSGRATGRVNGSAVKSAGIASTTDVSIVIKLVGLPLRRHSPLPAAPGK